MHRRITRERQAIAWIRRELRAGRVNEHHVFPPCIERMWDRVERRLERKYARQWTEQNRRFEEWMRSDAGRARLQERLSQVKPIRMHKDEETGRYIRVESP